MPEPSQQPKSASAAQSNEKTQESKKPQDKCFFGDDECEHNVDRDSCPHCSPALELSR